MNTNSNTNTGTTENVVVNNLSKKRGRKANPNLTRKLYLSKSEKDGQITYIPRKKGAPSVGSTTFFTRVQRSVKNNNFIFNANVMTVESEVVGPRKSRVSKVTVNRTEPVQTSESTPVSDSSVSTGTAVAA